VLALVLTLALGGIRPGASWGFSEYDPASDPYSMQNITAGDGVQALWNAGYTVKLDPAASSAAMAAIDAGPGEGDADVELRQAAFVQLEAARMR
jgi:hypothetical protein